MKDWKRKIAAVAAAGLVASAVVVTATGPAHAQVAAAVNVAFENDHGASASCDLPAAPSTVGSTNVLTNAWCEINGSASGAIDPPTGDKNFCAETVTVNAAANVQVARPGCSVSVHASFGGNTTTATRTSETSVVYTCSGAGVGTATYTPAPGSSGRSMSGPVVVNYTSPNFTAEGFLYNLQTVTAGHIKSAGVDGCAPSSARAASPENFIGTIN